MIEHRMKLPQLGQPDLDSVFGVEFFDGEDGRPVVVLSEHPNNKGRSITNAYEYVATDVLARLQQDGMQVEPMRIRWLEHKRRAPMSGRPAIEWSEVLLSWDGRRLHSPQWIWMRDDPRLAHAA